MRWLQECDLLSFLQLLLMCLFHILILGFAYQLFDAEFHSTQFNHVKSIKDHSLCLEQIRLRKLTYIFIRLIALTEHRRSNYLPEAVLTSILIRLLGMCN